MFPYSFANDIAEDFIDLIADVSERVEIVGSLRRHRTQVHDIDIVVIPRFANQKDGSLFGGTVTRNLLDMRLTDIYHKDQFTFESNGPKLKRLIKAVGNERIPMDIYIANEESWWTLLLIRTGSRTHNIAMACRAMERHMHLKADGSGLLSPGGTLIPIHSEEEIFQHLGLDYRPPEARE